MNRKIFTLMFFVVLFIMMAAATCSGQPNERIFSNLVFKFKTDAEAHGLTVPDNIVIGFTYKLGYDTLTELKRDSATGIWTLKIAAFVEYELLESSLYYSLAHAMALNACPYDRSITHMVTGRLNERRKRLLFLQIRQFQSLCK